MSAKKNERTGISPGSFRIKPIARLFVRRTACRS